LSIEARTPPTDSQSTPADTDGAGVRGPSISMVVPALNEADNLIETIPQAIAVLEGMGVDYEVLVVDDGSTDQTPQVMRTLRAAHPRLRSIRLRRNAGKAAALSIGFDLARNDVIVMMDADGQDEPTEIPKLAPRHPPGPLLEKTHVAALQRHHVMGQWRPRT
jgi:glycosyltransferase involved in cell wall biosynthesis